MTSTTEQDLRVNRNQENLLRRITNRIRLTLELQDILSATVAEVRSLLDTDRVMIYKFHPDRSGQVIAESINDCKLPSLLSLNFPADDIPEHAREMFIKSRVRSVVNVNSKLIGQSPVREEENGEVISEDIRYRPVDPCHVEYLTAMGVQSSVVTPIIDQNQLWGLLVSHHSQPRSVSEYELEVVQMVVDQLSVAIAQSTLLTQTRTKATREAIINKIATLLHSLPTVELEPALKETVIAFGGSGGRLCIKSAETFRQNNTFCSLEECLQSHKDYIKVYTYGEQPLIPELAKYPLIEQYSVWQEHYKCIESDIWAISDIYQTQEMRNLQVAFRPTKIRSVLMIPLHYRQQLLGYLSIFRDEVETETLWAGQYDSDQRQLYPRLSFEIWRESKKAQAREWTADDIELAQELDKQFATSIYQYELYQQVHALNNNLESQVQERTAALQLATEQQQALFGVVAKMRESLNVDTIFKTITKEVCQLLQTDRVSVYRFDSDWGGKFVGDFEIATPQWSNLSKIGINAVWQDTYLQETQGGRYRNHETYAVDDIYAVGYSTCHIEILEQFGIKAYAIAPIFVGKNLWGLLAAYQHGEPRHWEASEIQFLSQIAAQLGVALQQAELLTQTQKQAEQLTQAIQDLQQSQSQLIQTEKMSSLGQLVAGVAHEINNPVNFIYGNLDHISEYAGHLLRMLELYQRDCNPSDEICDRAEEIDLEFIAEDLPRILASVKLGSDRIRQIVLSLRNFSRLDQAEMKAVNIHEGIDSTLLILQHRLKTASHSPTIKIIKEYDVLPLVECYAGQLNQVFMNVLSNAIDALEIESESASYSDTGQITITTALGKLDAKVPSVVIRIADNGLGIPAEVLAQIFNPFFTTKPVGKGTGLGLSISYQIVTEKHGGVFKCDSQQGLGTQFYIEIPIQQISEESC